MNDIIDNYIPAIKKNILLCFVFAFSVHAKAGHFLKELSCTISVPGKVSLEGPGFLTLQFSYTGGGVALLPQVSQLAEMTAPQNWERRYNLNMLSGLEYPYELKTGEKKEIKINLHEYFSVMAPGNFRIPFRLNLTVKLNGEKQNWLILDTLRVIVSPADERLAERFIKTTTNNISKSKSWIDRTELYKQLFFMHIGSPLLVQNCINCLNDANVASIHPYCRERFASLAVACNALDTLFGYIIKNGSRDDEILFSKPGLSGKLFSPDQVKRLLHHSNPWVELYTIKYCTIPYRETELEHLKEKLDDLLKAYRQLEDKN